MEKLKIPRLMFSATASGTGKTTACCAILQALKNRNMNVISYKCGPDYIDPMFHSEIIKTPSRNLDSFFTDEKTLKSLFASSVKKCSAKLAIIEGVMGHYDGIAGTTTLASAYEISCIIGTPVVLILNCKGMSTSLAAVLKGFMEYRENANIKGVILNNVSEMLYPAYKKNLEEQFDVKVCGYLPFMAECSLESRHLGLVSAGEVENLKDKLQALAAQAEKSIDFSALLKLANTAVPLEYEPLSFKRASKAVTIAVAKDNAFCFLYEDNLELLHSLGADIKFFSPLTDKALPENTSGIILSGGYPECYAQELCENKAMLQAINIAINSGVPTIAECGGFLYLCNQITTDNQDYPLAGVIKTNCENKNKLQHFGYITLTANADNLLCKKGEQIRAHEFHYYDTTDNGNSFTAVKPVRNTNWNCVFSTKTLYAGFPHLYLYSNIKFAENFIEKCRTSKR